ncbi:MAG: C4-dicarboxylate ABC transporter permease [Deltaproteobacteria bacterium]|nr:MAG: C4-dicarboxylate ABC transporter permease [Deltaproteobacteria bacterium]
MVDRGKELLVKDEERGAVSIRQRLLRGKSALLVRYIAIAFSLFQLYTGIFQFTAMNQRVPHVIFAYILIFLLYPIKTHGRKDCISWDGYLFALISLGIGLYVLSTWFKKIGAIGMAIPWYELIMGGIFIVLSIDAARRTVGWAFPCVAIFFLIYARFGEMLPGPLAHKNYEIERIITSMFITTEGIFGMLAGISATFVFLFILFGSMLREAGGGEFFLRLAYGLFGHVRGGPAKVAVVASSLFGMMSGSGTANVAGTGQITIPLMKRTGYRAHFAGAVETAASAGGLLMPPIMGSAVFIIMELLGVTYLTIIKAAILTAILYYIGLFLMIDIEAQKIGLVGLKKEEIPPLKETLKDGWHFLIPIAVLIYFVVVPKVSVTRAAFWATMSIPAVSMLRWRKRATIKQILDGLEKGARTALPVVAILALGGVVVGMITLTGLGLMMSSVMIELSGGHLLFLLVLAMIATIIMGMGVPPVAAYIVLAILVVPALIKMGVYPLAAHLFVFYFAVIAGITPPMAPDAFVASGIADSPMMKTALTACRLALVIFILPYIFVYNNALLLVGSYGEIVWVMVTAILGVFALASALQGYMKRTIPIAFRGLLLLSALGLIMPGFKTDLVGLGLLFLVALYQVPDFFKKYSNVLLREGAYRFMRKKESGSSQFPRNHG